jgi:hypothetical protein
MHPISIRNDVRMLRLSSIRRDGETQGRISINSAVVRAYAELMRDGTSFPPIQVRFDGVDYWLSDGFQRVAAAEMAGLVEVMALVLD